MFGSPAATLHQGLVQVRVGIAFVEPVVPLNPKVVVVFAASAPLYPTFCTVMFAALAVSVPLQSWLIVWPLAKVHLTVQPVIGELPAVTVTWAPKFPGHELVTAYVAAQAPPEGVPEGVADGVA